MKSYPRLCFVVIGMLAIWAWGAERHRTSSIRVENNRVTIAHTWPQEDHRYGGLQQVYFAPTSTGEWKMVSESWREMGDEESEYSQAIDADSPSGFFKVVDVPAQADLWEIDSDYDMLVDAYEMSIGSDPYNSDSDGDGLSDFEENNAGTDPWDPDTDGDGVGDFEEVSLYWNPLSIDSDEDGLNDGGEFYVYGSDGMNPDSDYDGMDDRWEAEYDLNPISEYDADTDPDCDGLTNLEEYLLGTNPRNDDTDCDGMSDGEEVARGRDPLNPGEGYRDSDGDGLSDDDEMWLGTDPENADSDDDGLLDGLEDNIGTNPLDSDSDGDGLEDFWEVMRGLNPLSPDSDGDGMDDLWEVEKGLDPCDGSDRSGDTDGDGLTNFKEYMEDTNPNSPDTDGDGMDDGWEMRHYFDPKLADDGAYDPDCDGLANRDECRYGTDPQMWDTDGDGLSDGEEVVFGTNPLNRNTLNATYDDFIMYHSNGKDPTAVDARSGLTNWQLAFYGTDAAGEVRMPRSSDTNAVLCVSVSGSGYGELKIGEKTVSLFGDGRDERHNALQVSVARGIRLGISMSAPETLEVSVNSGDYAIGELPSVIRVDRAPAEAPARLKNGAMSALGGGTADAKGSGWISFPKTKATVACIHDLTTRLKQVLLDPGPDVSGLVCTWDECEGVGVENRPPLAAVLRGEFPLRETREVCYRLSHKHQLFGEGAYSQTVRYCPQDDDVEDEAEEDDGGESEGDWSSDPRCWCLGAYCEDWGCECPCHGIRPQEEPEDPEMCPEHNMSYRDCEPLHQEAYDHNRTIGEAPNVLKLHDPEEPTTVALVVPEAVTNCCECPEHTGRKVCLATSSERLRVEDEDGRAFVSTEEDTKVSVTGVSPSRDIRDAKLAFAGGGKIVERRAYTVLGMRIESEGDYLAKVGENTPIALVTDVGLSEGDVRLAFHVTRGHFRIWRYGATGGMDILLDSEEKPELTVDIRTWRQMMKECTTDRRSQLKVLTEAPGSFVLEFGFALEKEGMSVKDIATKAFANRSPRFVFDYNRDGVIDEKDVSDAKSGKVFRFWVNDDADDGIKCEDADYESDVPGQGSDGNASDRRVNGLRDLADLTPVWIDFSEPREDGMSDDEIGNLSWTLRSDCVNVVWSSLERKEAGGYQRKDQGSRFGKGLGEPLESASVVPCGASMELEPDFKRRLSESLNAGVFLIEGARPGTELVLEGWREEGNEKRKIVEAHAKISVDSVERMYRWMPLRYVCGQEDLVDDVHNMNPPSNRPDAECTGSHYVFVHGFNVNIQEARAIGAEMFKRLWQSGFTGGFTVADWFGSDGQLTSRVVQLIGDGTVTLNYYANVEHAFATAPSFASACSQLPAERVILAHSLGNILVSSAIVDSHLSYELYYLLNAAVAIEAYKGDGDKSLSMRDPDWGTVPEKYLACEWHKFFSTPDVRATLTWRDRFKGIGNLVNCYSASDKIVGNSETNVTSSLAGSVWRAQELLKGATFWEPVNSVSFEEKWVPIEGGWGVNGYYAADLGWYLFGFRDRKEWLTRREAIRRPLFRPFTTEPDKMMSPVPFIVDDPEAARMLQAKLLGDAIPALTQAMGANLFDKDTDINLEALPGGPGKWNHSDMKQLAYRSAHGLFDILVKKGKGVK